MVSEYKSCRYNGKRMRQHRAIFLAIVEKMSFTEDERKEYVSQIVVHHMNGNTRDNRRCNLHFMTRKLHSRLHSMRRHRDRFGRFV